MKRTLGHDYDADNCHACQTGKYAPELNFPEMTPKNENSPYATETQETVKDWQRSLLGTAGTPLQSAARANEEMAELLKVLSASVVDEDKAAEEGADIVIVMIDMFRKLNRDMWEEITKKMKINRARNWGPVVDGRAYHIKATNG